MSIYNKTNIARDKDGICAYCRTPPWPACPEYCPVDDDPPEPADTSSDARSTITATETRICPTSHTTPEIH